MSQENVELVRRLFNEFGTGFPVDEIARRMSDATLEEFFDPEIEWVPVAQSLQAVDSYRGYEGVRRFWTDILSTWDEYALEPERFVDAGDQVAAIMRMKGRTQGVEVDETWSSLNTIRNGRIVRVEGFTSRDEALEAVGLSE